MGHHDPKIFTNHYISKTTLVDVQSIVQGEPERKDIIIQSQCLSNFRDENAPRRITEADMKRVEEDNLLIQLKDNCLKLKESIYTEYSSIRKAPYAVQKTYNFMKYKEKHRRETLTRQILKQTRDNWFKRKQVSPEGLQGNVISYENMISSLGPVHKFIADAFFGNKYSQLEVIHSLVQLSCSMVKGSFKQGQDYQLKEAIRSVPSLFICLWAGCAIKLQTSTAAARHIQGHIRKSQLQCKWNRCSVLLFNTYELRRHLKLDHKISDRARIFKSKTCCECTSSSSNFTNLQFNCEFTWDDHCLTHLNNITRINRCPYCLEDTSITASDRIIKYTSAHLFKKHLISHIRNQSTIQLHDDSAAAQMCTHPICKNNIHLVYSIKGLLDHFKSEHNTLITS